MVITFDILFINQHIYKPFYIYRGRITHIKIPSFMREHVYRLYSFSFGCNLDEISKDLKHYKTMNAFFTRRLKSKVRPISPLSPLVSPVDGTILHFGKANGEWVEQIKGIQYRLKSLIGEDAVDIISSNQPNHLKSKKLNDIPDNLYYMVIYLGPGDYHGVHSPTDFTITHSRHFPGHLFSVSPKANSMIRNLLAINERVCINGFWDHGFFSITPVGAYNVGSITLEFDSKVQTNLANETAESNYKDRFYEKGVRAKKGECISFFNLGSTVVLLFQAPVNQLKWNIEPYQKIKLGQPLASLSKNNNNRLE